MNTRLSNKFVEISNGYTTIKSGNMNGVCTIRCYVSIRMRVNGFARIDVHFPQNGIFEVSDVWVDNTKLETWDALPVSEMMVELNPKGISFFGRIPQMESYNLEEFVNDLLRQVDVWVDFAGSRGLGAKYRKSVCLVEFRPYDFARGQMCAIYGATDHFTLKDLAERAVTPRACTNYALVLPGGAEEYVNSDLLGRDDYDPTTYVGKSGSLYSFVFELGL